MEQLRCHNCGVIREDLRCYDCYRRLRDKFVPIEVLQLQKMNIDIFKDKLQNDVRNDFNQFQDYNIIERISLLQKKKSYFMELRNTKEREKTKILSLMQALKENNHHQQSKKNVLFEIKNKLLIQIKQMQYAIQDKQKSMKSLQLKFIRMNYSLRQISHSYSDWTINEQLQLNHSRQTKTNSIILKKNYQTMSNEQIQQIVFAINQVQLLIYELQHIQGIDCCFRLWKDAKNNSSVIIGQDLVICDRTNNIINEQNIIYLYLHYKLVLKSFQINITRNTYFFFDFDHLLYEAIAKLSGDLLTIHMKTHHLLSIKTQRLSISYDNSLLTSSLNTFKEPFLFTFPSIEYEDDENDEQNEI